MFFHYAGACGVTVDQFERVALCAHLNMPQSPEDEKLDVARISHIYKKYVCPQNRLRLKEC